MYPVTQEYQNKIKENIRTVKAEIKINHSKGELILTDKDIALGSLIYTEGSQAGEEFTIGGTVASDLSFSIINKPEYADIDFEGAKVMPTIALLLSNSVDTENYFLTAPQPSEFEEGEGVERWEYVPLGIFNIDDAIRQRNTIQIKAIDNMIEFDKPYSLSKLSYPATLYQIYVNACNVCDVNVGTIDFPNKDYIVTERPSDDLTFRDVIGYVAELAGSFAKVNRAGALEIKWYTPTNLELGPMNRFNFKTKDYTVQIKGIMATVDDTTYLAGTDEYAVDLSDNPLLQGGYETVLPNIYNNIKDTVFTPYDSNWQGNPAIQAGDMITQIDIDGKIYNTLITKSTFKYRGRSSLEAKGLPEISRGYKGSTNRRIAQIKRVVEKEVGDKLTNLEQAQLNATELMANMLGGHFIEDKENGVMYIANHPDITKATEYWKWGIGGFTHYKDGVLGSAITADDSIVAMLVAANIVTANMVVTGQLQSQDGSTWINLDTGAFNFKNALKWIDGQLEIDSPQIDDLDSRNRVFKSNTLPKTPYYKGDIYIDDTLRIWICNTNKSTGTPLIDHWDKMDSGTKLDLIIMSYNSMVRNGSFFNDGDRTKFYIQETSPNLSIPYDYIRFYPNSKSVEYVIFHSIMEGPNKGTMINLEPPHLYDVYNEIWKYSPDYPNIPANFYVNVTKFTTNSPFVTSTNKINPPYKIGDLWSDGENSPLRVCIRGKNIGENFEDNDWILATNAVGLGQLYNNVLISSAFGIQVKDSEGKERVRLGNYEYGKYGLLIKDTSGNKTILDEDGILQSWQEGRTDNISTGYPLTLSLYVPSNAKVINQVILRFKRDYFRAYSTGSKSYQKSNWTSFSGAEVATTSGSHTDTLTNLNPSESTNSNYVHNHGIRDDRYIRVKKPDGTEDWAAWVPSGAHTHGSHTHSIEIDEHSHQLPDISHSHDIIYGIYTETSLPINIKIRVNGTDRTSILGGGTGFNSDQSNLNITNYIAKGQWNTIEISGTGNGRIDASVFIQALMTV